MIRTDCNCICRTWSQPYWFSNRRSLCRTDGYLAVVGYAATGAQRGGWRAYSGNRKL